jgi:hypothetical protein
MLRTLLCLLVLGSARVVAGGEVYDRFPDVIDAAGRYVIYAHGLIVEGDGPPARVARVRRLRFPGGRPPPSPRVAASS